MRSVFKQGKWGVIFAVALSAVAVAACGEDDDDDGPDTTFTQNRSSVFELPSKLVHEDGDPGLDEDVFRFGTFNN